MKRFFNTAGPVNPAKHYCLPLQDRLDVDELLMLIEQEKYFVLHAPRQTGKTTALLELMDLLNKSGEYKTLYINVESAQAYRENILDAMQSIALEIGEKAKNLLNDTFPQEFISKTLRETSFNDALKLLLSGWSIQSQLPLVIFIDEIDSLIGDTLISVLRQLRSGYTDRPQNFPQSVVLCGIRDVRDYRIHSNKAKDIITGGSAYNIKAESLRLGDFNREEVKKTAAKQTLEYMDKCGTKEGYIIIFDRTPGKNWEEKIYTDTASHEGKTLPVWGM